MAKNQNGKAYPGQRKMTEGQLNIGLQRNNLVGNNANEGQRIYQRNF